MSEPNTISDNVLATCTTECGKFTVLKNDFIGKWMMRGDHFEIECVRKLTDMLNEGDVVLDIGANIGCYTIPFGQTVGLSGQVHSFEPQGVIYEVLNQNIVQNGLEKVCQANHMAVGHIPGKTSLNARCDRGREIKYDRSEETNFGGVNLGMGGEEIPMVSVDSYVDELGNDVRVKMIKIDVEGAERLVIAGARKTIEEHRPIVFYEDNYKRITKDMVKMFGLTEEIIKMDLRKYFVEELGYSRIERIKENYLCIP